MRSITILFCGLVLVTCLVSTRWGGMAALVFFVFALMTAAVAVSRWPAL